MRAKEMQMTKEFDTIVGIDLGTTNSCIAYVDENGKSKIIRNKEGKLTANDKNSANYWSRKINW